MNTNKINDIISTLQIINNEIVNNHSLSLDDAYTLLLIIYNELILNHNTSPVILSYLTIILHNFINYKNSNDNNIQLITELMHKNLEPKNFTDK